MSGSVHWLGDLRTGLSQSHTPFCARRTGIPDLGRAQSENFLSWFPVGRSRTDPCVSPVAQPSDDQRPATDEGELAMKIVVTGCTSLIGSNGVAIRPQGSHEVIAARAC